jgi:hypothetical protein
LLAQHPDSHDQPGSYDVTYILLAIVIWNVCRQLFVNMRCVSYVQYYSNVWPLLSNI